MEWFKHQTGSLDDPDFNAILDEFGSDGYMMFFGLLEIYGREYSSINSDGFLSVRLAFVARKLRKSSVKVQKFLNFCEKSFLKPRFVFNIHGPILSYKVPRFIELASNWTKRKDKLPTETPTEGPTAIEEEYKKKKEKKNKNPYNGLAKTVLDYLNEKTGKRFTDMSFIIARLNEGKTVEQCMTIINNQLKDEYFINNPKFLNPQTLFRPTHWDKYLNNTPCEISGKANILRPTTYAQAESAERRMIARALLKDRDKENETNDQKRNSQTIRMLSAGEKNG